MARSSLSISSEATPMRDQKHRFWPSTIGNVCRYTLEDMVIGFRRRMCLRTCKHGQNIDGNASTAIFLAYCHGASKGPLVQAKLILNTLVIPVLAKRFSRLPWACSAELACCSHATAQMRKRKWYSTLTDQFLSTALIQLWFATITLNVPVVFHLFTEILIV